MANVTAPGQYSDSMGDGPFIFDLPVGAGAKLFRTILVSQLTANGAAVPYSTASTGVCVGVAQHDIDNTGGAAGDKRARVETKRAYAFANGTSGDAFSEATLIGSVVYGSDDHTVAKVSTGGRKAVGFFLGMESDGRVRVFVDPMLARIVDVLQTIAAAPADAATLRNNIVAAFG